MTTSIALAGFGAWGRMHANAIAANPEARLAAVYCHGEASKAAAAEAFPDVPRFDSYDAMLRTGGFEVVSVCVPNHEHAGFAVKALEAGAHVFLEKPLGLDLAQCDAVIAAARRSGRMVALDHELRVSHQWAAIRRMIASGDFGAVRHQQLTLFRHPFRLGSGGWRHTRAQVGSWMLEELVHFFDLLVWYAAEKGRPRTLRARGAGPRAAEGLHDLLVVEMEWADGSTALLVQNLAAFEHHIVFELTGSEGALRTWWSGSGARTLTPTFELKALRRGKSEPEIVSVPVSGESFELRENLAQTLRGFREGRSILPPEEARLSIEICLAAEESCRLGRPVELPR